MNDLSDPQEALNIFRSRLTLNLHRIRKVVAGKLSGDETTRTNILKALDEIEKMPEEQTLTDEKVRKVAALLIKFRGSLSTKVDKLLDTSDMERFNDNTLKPFLFAPGDGLPVIKEDVLCPVALYDGCTPKSDLGQVREVVKVNEKGEDVVVPQVTLGGRKHKTKKHKKKGKKKTMKKKGKKKTMKKKGKKKSMKKKGQKKSIKKKGKKSRK